jgi:L-alanine-DL-glutamate epimerase-like enolase superfamily enzyme
MKIIDIKAYPLSVPLKDGPRLAGGQILKRDTVLVVVRTDEGIIGYGESHHARAANAVAGIVNDVLQPLIAGHGADDIVGIWSTVYRRQLQTHGLGQAAVIAMSGIDIALWDIKAKAAGLPLYKLLGGGQKRIKAYAGGVALGFQAPESLVDEARPFIEMGYKALKLRMGESWRLDLARVRAIRNAFGDDMVIMVDANTSYRFDDVVALAPHLQDLNVYWLEEPFAPHDYKHYAAAAALNNVPLAAGENYYTRFEFARLVEEGKLSIFQPDVSKIGGVTEFMRVAALASAWKIPICPHSSLTAFNMATTMHCMLALDNADYFEADISFNPFRTQLTPEPYTLHGDGTVSIGDTPGIGFEPDMSFVEAHLFVPGPVSRVAN